MQFSIKDTMRSAIETASGGRNTIMYDAQGNPNVMVCITKFDCENMDKEHKYDFGSGIHPMFNIMGKEVDEIWIGKYQSSRGAENTPVSLPNGSIIADAYHIKEHCEKIFAKGPGWHPVTNSEWGGIAMIQHALRDGEEHGATMNGGYCYKHPGDIPGKVDYNVDLNGNPYPVFTGSGPQSWTHDGTPFGIYDVIGNVWELSKGACVYKDGNIMFSAVDGVPCNDPFDHELYYRKKEGSVAPGTLTMHDGRWLSFGQHIYEVSVKNDKGIVEKRFALSDSNVLSINPNAEYILRTWSGQTDHYSQVAHDHSAWLRQLALLPPMNIMREIGVFMFNMPDCDDYRELLRGCRNGDEKEMHSMYAYLPIMHPYLESSNWSVRVAWVSPDKI